jgi:hypothetical protein
MPNNTLKYEKVAVNSNGYEVLQIGGTRVP